MISHQQHGGLDLGQRVLLVLAVRAGKDVGEALGIHQKLVAVLGGSAAGWLAIQLQHLAKYQPMAYVLAPENKRRLDQDMLFQGEKPEAWLDVPIDVSDYEIIDLFNWQNSVKDMISQIEFVRMVDVQSETVERYIKDGKVKPDLSIPFGNKRMFHYFREESIVCGRWRA